MTSIKIKFRKSKSRQHQGTCYIQLIHKRKMTTIATGTILDEKEWDAKKSCVSFKGTSPHRAKELLAIQETLEKIANELEELAAGMTENRTEFTVATLVDSYKGQKLSQNFFALMEHRIQLLKEAGQERTATNYRGALRIFREFRKEQHTAADELTGLMMEEFQNYLKRKGNSLNTISHYMRILKAVYNYSLKKRWIKEDRHPFQEVFTGVEKTAKRATEVEVIDKLTGLDLASRPTLDLARDMFLFSLYTRGMSYIDIAHLTKENIKGNILVYKRHKTGQKIQVTLPDCALQIIRKYAGQMAESVLLFPLLYHPVRKKQSNYATALHIYNERLKIISGMLGLENPLTSYTPRHTWANLAKLSGVEMRVISEAMGHTSEDTTRIYLALINNSVLDKANETVINTLTKFYKNKGHSLK